jgi:hypothetical protein
MPPRDTAAQETFPEESLASAAYPADGRGAPGGRGGALRISRGARIALIATGVLLFLAISGVLARFFSAENVERDHEIALLQAEAKGDARGMLDQLAGCRTSASCVATVHADASLLRRPGAVQILSTQSTTDHSLTGSIGETRVAWKVNGRYPVVQCVRVRRSGNFLTGISISLLRVGPRIGSTADC